MRYQQHRQQIVDYVNSRDKFTGMPMKSTVTRNVIVITEGRTPICEVPNSPRQDYYAKKIVDALNLLNSQSADKSDVEVYP